MFMCPNCQVTFTNRRSLTSHSNNFEECKKALFLQLQDSIQNSSSLASTDNESFCNLNNFDEPSSNNNDNCNITEDKT